MGKKNVCILVNLIVFLILISIVVGCSYNKYTSKSENSNLKISETLQNKIINNSSNTDHSPREGGEDAESTSIKPPEGEGKIGEIPNFTTRGVPAISIGNT